MPRQAAEVSRGTTIICFEGNFFFVGVAVAVRSHFGATGGDHGNKRVVEKYKFQGNHFRANRNVEKEQANGDC